MNIVPLDRVLTTEVAHHKHEDSKHLIEHHLSQTKHHPLSISFRMSFLALFLDKIFPERRGTFACPCGAVKLTLQVPGSSYGVVEQTNAICHCHDCVGFVQACPNGIVVLQNNSTHMVQFYKSDVHVIKGERNIGYCKVKDETPLIRCYCKECGTPMGADITFGPVVLLYSNLIHGARMPLYLPNLVLNYASAPPESTRPYDRRVTVRKGLFCPIFLVRTITRVLLGFLMGKGNGGFLQNNYDSVPLGFNTIDAKKRK